MKWLKVSLLLLFPLFICSLKGQVNNLLNYSFEQYPNCGGFGYCINTDLTNWRSPTDATPDWMNPICHNGNFGMPQNYAGYQYARSGISYAGIGFDVSLGGYREYITGTLSDTLGTNKKYCVEFFVSLGDSLWYASSALGAYFSNDEICDSLSQTILPYMPQVENPLSNLLTDKIDWVPVSGEFQASGGEQFITIGDFYSNASSNFTYVDSGGSIWPKSISGTYYYIEDVSVRELTIANGGVSASINDKKIDTICVGEMVQIGKDTATQGVSFHWLPTKGLSNPNIAQPYTNDSVTTIYTLTVINDSVHGCNCTDSVTKDSVEIFVKQCVGIPKITNNRNIKISPNPSNGNFILSMNSISGEPEIEVYNLFGQKIYQSKIGSKITVINLGKEPDGVYYYRVLNENSELFWQGKIIIEK